MGENRNTIIEGDDRMAALKMHGRLNQKYHNKKYNDLLASDQYEIDMAYDELMTHLKANPPVFEDDGADMAQEVDEEVQKAAGDGVLDEQKPTQDTPPKILTPEEISDIQHEGTIGGDAT